MMLRSRALLLALIALVLCAPATADAKAKPNAKAPRAKLVAFDSCQALVGYAHRYAARAGGVGVPVRALAAAPETLERPVQKISDSGSVAPAAPQETSAAADGSGATTFSGTNVQEL